MTALKDKQEAFCREYLIDLNATQAAIRAGYSEKTARAIGSENLIKPDIQARLQELMSERNKRTDVDADWVLLKAKESFEFNAQQVFDNEGNPKMVNAAAAGKFLELCGKHTSVKAFEKEQVATENDKPITINFVPAVKPDAD